MATKRFEVETVWLLGYFKGGMTAKQELNRLGSLGWQLCAIDGKTAYLSRQTSDAYQPPAPVNEDGIEPEDMIGKHGLDFVDGVELSKGKMPVVVVDECRQPFTPRHVMTEDEKKQASEKDSADYEKAYFAARAANGGKALEQDRHAVGPVELPRRSYLKMPDEPGVDDGDVQTGPDPIFGD